MNVIRFETLPKLHFKLRSDIKSNENKVENKINGLQPVLACVFLNFDVSELLV